MTRRGLFVAFEGGEGSGKSTQAARVAAGLRAAGVPVTLTREPGGTVAGADIRAILLGSPPGSLPPRAEALLFLADRAVHVEQVIRPALDRGDVVVCDRFAASLLAYQGTGRGLPVGGLAAMSRWAAGGLAPDLVVLLDVDPRVGLPRAARVGAADTLEAEPFAFHDRVRAGFLEQADPNWWAVVDAGRPAHLVDAEVDQAVAVVLAAWACRACAEQTADGPVLTHTGQPGCRLRPTAAALRGQAGSGH